MNNDDLLSPEQKAFKEKVLKLEQESINNINKFDDKMMVSKIVRLFEETQKK